MAGSKSDAFEVDLLKKVTGQTTSFLGTAITPYMALFTAVTDGEAGTVTEVTTSGTAYARLNSSGKWAAPVSGAGTVSTNADCTWSVATADWGTIVGWGLYDASTSGNLFYYSDLRDASNNVTTKTVANGDQFKIGSGNATITEG